MKVRNINIKELAKTLIEIYEAGYDFVDMEVIDELRIKVIPLKIQQKLLDSPHELEEDEDLEKYI